MTQEHAITPPPELVQQWATTNGTTYEDLSVLCQSVATQAARWGADQELEACCEWMDYQYPGVNLGGPLRATRRPPTVPETIKVNGYTYRLVK